MSHLKCVKSRHVRRSSMQRPALVCVGKGVCMSLSLGMRTSMCMHMRVPAQTNKSVCMCGCVRMSRCAGRFCSFKTEAQRSKSAQRTETSWNLYICADTHTYKRTLLIRKNAVGCQMQRAELAFTVRSCHGKLPGQVNFVRRPPPHPTHTCVRWCTPRGCRPGMAVWPPTTPHTSTPHTPA